MEEQNIIPKPAFWLGYAGLIPFFIAALLFHTSGSASYGAALIGYGAVILSFLGGVRWGLAIVDSSSKSLLLPLFYSILPSLIGWIALFLPSQMGFILLSCGFFATLLADMKLKNSPTWYARLRIPLSLGAITCLIFAFLVQSI